MGNNNYSIILLNSYYKSTKPQVKDGKLYLFKSMMIS